MSDLKRLCLGKAIKVSIFMFIMCVVAFAISVLDVIMIDSDIPRREVIPNQKYLLLWTPTEFCPLYYFTPGNDAFTKNNCSFTNCYVTGNRNYFGRNITKFDAIGFNGRNIMSYRQSDLPPERAPHQKYIYFNMESADNFPVCSPLFDNFFNWTSTYKLDSDVPIPYIQIKDKHGAVIGPSVSIKWDHIKFKPKYNNTGSKTKAAAWFASNCKDRSKRLQYVTKLQKALKVYNLEVDIYGNCGKHKCPRDQQEQCATLVENDYYFYLSFENSFSEDYVTEKLLTAVQRNIVPIVRGGANYHRFLPPNSYLDASNLSPADLAHTMNMLIKSPQLYNHFLRNWKPYYSYNNPVETDNVCRLCEALNSPRYHEHSVYDDFRSWWLPSHRSRCM